MAKLLSLDSMSLTLKSSTIAQYTRAHTMVYTKLDGMQTPWRVWVCKYVYVPVLIQHVV